MLKGKAKSREVFSGFFRKNEANQEPFMSAVIFILTRSPPHLAHLSALGETNIAVKGLSLKTFYKRILAPPT